MSSNSNDQIMMLSVQLSLIFMGIAIMAVAAVAVAGLAAFLLTFAALIAWNKPKRFGPVILTPHKAHSIISNGIGMALGGPLGLIAFQYFAGKPISWGIMPLLALGGYAVAALLVFKFGADQDEEQEAQAPASAPMHVIESIQHTPAAPPHQPRFASWNDEEELK